MKKKMEEAELRVVQFELSDIIEAANSAPKPCTAVCPQNSGCTIDSCIIFE